MWKPAKTMTTAFLTVALSSAAHAGSSDAVVGAIVSAGFGAAIGHSIDGRQGAILGSALGAVAGTALANNNDAERDYRDRRNTRVSYVPVEQPVYAQPVYTQPAYQAVYAQPVVYYSPQPVRVVYRNDNERAHGWRHEHREWREERRAYRHGYHQGYHNSRDQDRRWD